MCYVLVKKPFQIGCVAIETTPDEELIELMDQLTSVVDENEVQIVTISRPSAYGEYEPYQIMNNKEEFIRAAMSL